jgi:sugar (pentulose or hexulose) kinase
MNNTLIFDIGKTNKKALVFDENYQVIEEKQTTFDEIGDVDGDPTDDVLKISAWMLEILRGYEKLNITHINFATYGATIAHLDEKGALIAQPFNYLKKIDPSVKNAFFSDFGFRISGNNDLKSEIRNPKSEFCTATASPDLDFLLNSGFQLYWLKKTRPDFFNKIKTTLHLPQYFCYALTGQLASEYTSIGCHTMLWDFNKKTYHNWVEKEGIKSLLPDVLQISTTFQGFKTLGRFKIGIGIHDSSAALLPYLMREKTSFLLLSTGTWSICLNPFNNEPLTADEFAQDCLFYMRPDGAPVKASRLFLGKIHDEAVEKLTAEFHQKPEAIRDIRFNNEIYEQIRNPKSETRNLTEGYHALMFNLIKTQVEKIKLAAGKTDFEKILVDGGFAKNDVYLNMLKKALPNVQIEPSDMPQGTALGAAMALNFNKI